MSKHKQIGSLDSLINSSKERPLNPEPDNISVKVESLERRVGILEGLLNDVMIQLDTPTRNQKLNGNSTPKSKSNPVSKPKDKPKPKSKPSPVAQNLNRDKASEQVILDMLSDGETVESRSFEKKAREDGTISRKKVKLSIKNLVELGKIVRSQKKVDDKWVGYITLAK